MYNEKEMAIIKEAICKLRLNMINKFYPSDIHKSDVRFTPAKVIQIFEDLGFSCDFGDENGWEQDTWYLLDKGDIHLNLYYSGYYFTMDINLREEEDEE